MSRAVRNWPTDWPTDRGEIARRTAGDEPLSYDRDTRTVDAILSKGSPVKRFYGTEVLQIAPGAVALGRVSNGGISVLDSHNQWGIDAALGRIQKTWFDRGALMGKIGFNDTDQGRKAEGMVSRGELSGISIGYRVDEWEIADNKGNIIDPETDRIRWDDEDLTFTATRWELLEASLVTVPADADAQIRSLTAPHGEVAAALARVQARQELMEHGHHPSNPHTYADWLRR